MSVNEAAARGPLLRMWDSYNFFVEDHTSRGKEGGAKDISYWQDRLFTNLIVYSFPVCLIALIPGMFMWIEVGHPGFAVFERLVACAMFSIAVTKRIQLLYRKIFVILMFYSIAILLIAYLGLLGPGGMYLLAIGIFVPLILPLYMAYWSIAINFVICTSFALIINFRLFNIPLIDQYRLDTFVGVFTNSIFLNLAGVLLIKNILKGLEDTLLKEVFLQKELQNEVNERTLSNERLKESEEYYTSLFMLNPSPMWVLDSATLQFLQVNEAAVRSYGYSNEEFLSMTVKNIKMEDDTDVLVEDLQKNVTQGTPLSIFAKHRRKNKEEFYAEVIFNTISFKGKSCILVISEDISVQVDYIKAIEAQNEKLREIAWIQSHKVRSPLATILGLVELFNDSVPGVPAEEIIQGIMQSSHRLDLVIRETSEKASTFDITNIHTGNIARLFPDKFSSGYRSY